VCARRPPKRLARRVKGSRRDARSCASAAAAPGRRAGAHGSRSWRHVDEKRQVSALEGALAIRRGSRALLARPE
jgi:hypothetical protein